MLAYSAHPAAVSTLPGWTLFFAREPEPDLDFDDDLEDLEDSPSGGYTPKSPQKKRGSPWLKVILLLVLAGGGGYLAMEPDLVMDFIGPLIGESPPPPAVVQPPPKTPANVPSPTTGMPAPATVAAIPSPQFSEGQLVAVILDPAAPGGSLSLSADPGGTRPGPKVPPGATLTVMDGELHNNTWVYSVRTKAGAAGWIAEKRLVAKP